MDYCYNPFFGFDSRNRHLVRVFFGGPMRHSKAEKAKTHKRIVAIASKRFREEGLAGVGIAELMKEAGLTVGGFYKHFDSRDHLVAEALSSAFGGWKRRVDAAASGGTAVSLANFINDYWNEAHRADPGTGCAFSALAAEIGRSHERTRALTTEQARNDIQLIVGLIPDNDPHAARSKGISISRASLAARSLAPPVSDEALSREILR